MVDWNALATIGAGALGLYGASSASSAAKQAAQTSAAASDKGVQAMLAMYEQSRQDMAPWRQQGTWAVNKLGGAEGMIAKGPGQFLPEEDPGYKFGYQEFIENPSLRMASATGKLGSGATLKALTRYASDYASTKYDNFLNRYYQSMDPYFRMAGLGSNVAMTGGQQAGTTGANVAQGIMSGGQAQAGGQMASAYPYYNLANWGATNLLQWARDPDK